MIDEPLAPLRGHVLFATDDSEAARMAEHWLVRLRWRDPRVVSVLTVAMQSLRRLGWTMRADRAPVGMVADDLRESERIAGERITNLVGERLQRADLTVHTLARQGDPADVVLRIADEERPDLVVVGARGRSRLVALVLGSVSQSVVSAASVPVLVARQVPPLATPLPGQILVVVDGSLDAHRAIDWLQAAGWLAGARLTLLGILGDPAGLGWDEPDLIADVEERVRADARETLAALATPLAAEGVDPELELRSGHPVASALAAIDELAPDLVAVVRPTARGGRRDLADRIMRESSVTTLVIPGV